MKKEWANSIYSNALKNYLVEGSNDVKTSPATSKYFCPCSCYSLDLLDL